MKFFCGGGLVLSCIAGVVSLFVGPDARAAEKSWNPEAAARYSRSVGGTVLLVYRGGRPVFEEYLRGVSSSSPLPCYSITKTLVALTCLSSPRLSLSSRVAETKPAVTVRQLLSQTSGICAGYERLYSPGIINIRKSAAALKSEFPPGTHFTYGPSHYEILGNLPGLFEPPAAPALAQLLGQLDIRPTKWRTDKSGNFFLSAGAFLTPPDFLKIGKFVLDRGRAGGARPLIPPRQLSEAFRGTDANPCYGLGFWLNARAAQPEARERDIEESIDKKLSREDWRATCLSKSAPPDLVCMAGSGGQRIYVIPSLRSVVVRLGKPDKFRDPEFLESLFNKRAL